MLFSTLKKASAAASLVLVCAGANAQTWTKDATYGLYVSPTKGTQSNVTIGFTPVKSFSDTKLTVKNETGLNAFKVINPEGSIKMLLSDKGGLSIGTGAKANTNGLLVSGNTQLKCNLSVTKNTEVGGDLNVVGKTTLKSDLKIDGSATIGDKLITNGFVFKGNDKWRQTTDMFYNGTHMMFSYKRAKSYGSSEYEPGQIDFLGGKIFFGSGYSSNEGKGLYPIESIIQGKLAIGDDLFMNYNPSAQLDVKGDAIINGRLTCTEEIEVADLNSNSINVNSLNAKDIQMDMHGAADYVFDENYNLKSLSEVESFINENKHLPGMPSAAEMDANGVSVSKLTNLLLEKVEELTLHMIQLEKENAALKATVKSISK